MPNPWPFILVLLFGCASQSGWECPDLQRLARTARSETFRYPDGSLAADGAHLPGWQQGLAGRVPAWQNVTPVGTWHYFYESGRRRATITYALSCYIECCSGGPCPQVHAYPVGDFTLWYESGAVRAKGSFVASREHVDTSCEGGDFTLRARTSPETKAWDEQGELLNLQLPAVITEEFLPNGS